MALIVETGLIVPGAESYVSVAGATAYHLARGNAAWGLLVNGPMEEALRRATDFMEQMYRRRWKGTRVTAAQSLCWPRQGVQIEDAPASYYAAVLALNIVPIEVQNACSEFALKASAGLLAPDLQRAKSSVKVGDIGVTYDPASVEYPRYRAMDAMLAPYLTGSPLNVRVVRG